MSVPASCPVSSLHQPAGEYQRTEHGTANCLTSIIKIMTDMLSDQLADRPVCQLSLSLSVARCFHLCCTPLMAGCALSATTIVSMSSRKTAGEMNPQELLDIDVLGFLACRVHCSAHCQTFVFHTGVSGCPLGPPPGGHAAFALENCCAFTVGLMMRSALGHEKFLLHLFALAAWPA